MNWASLRGTFERIPTVVLDAGLVVVVAIAISISIAVAPEPSPRRPDLFAYGIGVAIAALLFLRRSHPVGVLLGSTALLTLYYNLDYPGFFPALPLLAALYTAAEAGKFGLAWGVTAVYVLGPLLFRTLVDPEPILRVLNDTLRDAAQFGAVISLGWAIRSRRAYAAEVAERLRRAEAERERVAEELKVAHLVQQQFLPEELPDIPGWRVAAFYRSAREVGGDFYDLTKLPNGSIGITIGDVTDKGAPAALVMATTQGLLRSEAQRLASPSQVLEHVNDVLVLNTPTKMFVTCLYMVLDPFSGRLAYANAGHNLPYVKTDGGVSELRATGVPLGLMPGMTYEEKLATVSPDTLLLLQSDGLGEAHNEDREMFGFPRIVKVMESIEGSDKLIDELLAELDGFVGGDWEQEDDITLVTLERTAPSSS
jgi:serine phosphatase RsbU (regulator of sigma subunit)